MTTLQKTIVAAAVITAAGVGIYEARQNANLRGEIARMQQQEGPLQIQQAQQDQDARSSQLAALQRENEQLKSAQKGAEVLRLRGEVGKLRQQNAASENQLQTQPKGIKAMMGDPAMKEYIHQAQVNLAKTRYGALFQELKLSPEQSDAVVQAITDTWLQKTEEVSRMKTAEGAGNKEVLEGTKNGGTDMKERLRSILGEAGYARYEQYEMEVPARTALQLLRTQLGETHPLGNDQVARIVQLVTAEPYETMHGLAGDLDKAFLGSQSDVDNHLQKVEQSNQHILQGAAGVLDAEQLNGLSIVLSNSVLNRKLQAAALAPKN